MQTWTEKLIEWPTGQDILVWQIVSQGAIKRLYGRKYSAFGSPRLEHGTISKYALKNNAHKVLKPPNKCEPLKTVQMRSI